MTQFLFFFWHFNYMHVRLLILSYSSVMLYPLSVCFCLFPTAIITFKYVDCFISCVLSTDEHGEEFFTSDTVYIISSNSISLFLISFII